MSEEGKKESPPPIVVVAGSCAGASVGIAALAFLLMHQFTDAGIWAVAAMVAAPSAMGVAIAYFMTKPRGGP